MIIFYPGTGTFIPDANLDEFIQTVYKSLANHKVSIPQNAERIIEKMVREDWLRSYLTIEGIDKTFKRISKRIGRNNNLGVLWKI